MDEIDKDLVWWLIAFFIVVVRRSWLVVKRV